MRRFYFQLEGADQVVDKKGRLYGNPIEAFRAAQRLARDVAEARPCLRKKTCVIVTERDRPDDLYCVSIQ